MYDTACCLHLISKWSTTINQSINQTVKTNQRWPPCGCVRATPYLSPFAGDPSGGRAAAQAAADPDGGLGVAGAVCGREGLGLVAALAQDDAVL